MYYNSFNVTLFLIINLVVSLLIARYLGSRRNIGFGWSLFFCLFLSPFLGFIITILSGKKNY